MPINAKEKMSIILTNEPNIELDYFLRVDVATL